MPRSARQSLGGEVYHVLNRAALRYRMFRTDKDFLAFEQLLCQAHDRFPGVRVLAWCVMSNHWHLLLWPRRDGELSVFMFWLTMTHAARYRTAHHTVGYGPLYQGRFKSFPVRRDEYLLAAGRYVERNPLRAKLVKRAEDWRWSSLRRDAEGRSLDPGPAPRGANWLEFVNTPMTEAEVAAIRLSLRRDRPYGTDAWTTETAGCLGLEYSIRARGRQPRLSIQRSQ